MKRTERHHLKQDEFIVWLEETADWVRINRRHLVNAFFVVAGAGLLLGGIVIHRGNRAAEAGQALALALDQYHGSVQAGDATTTGSGPTFESIDEKYRTALGSFQDVAERFSGYDAGRQAVYYVGLCQVGLKDYQAAASAFDQARGAKRDLLHYLSTRALAGVRGELGELSEAGDLYRSLIEDTENPLPKDYLLFDLGKLEERSGNLEQARRVYQRLLDEYPNSPIRGDVTDRSERVALQVDGDSASD